MMDIRDGYDGYDPLADFDLRYWYELAEQGMLSVASFLEAVLWWILRLDGATLEQQTRGGLGTVAAVALHLLAAVEDGETASDWLGWLPGMLAGPVKVVGLFLASYLGF